VQIFVISKIEELQEQYPLHQPISGEQNEKEFVKLYGQILKMKNIISTFDQFSGNEIISERDFQDYQSIYLGLYQKYRKTTDAEKEVINDDLVFEIELIKQVEINIDYIIELIKKYHEDHVKNKEILVDIRKAIDSSLKMRSKKDLIMHFIDQLDPHAIVEEEWIKYIDAKRKEELDKIIEEESLKSEETYKLMGNAFKSGILEFTGIEFPKILPPVSRFSPDGSFSKKKETVFQKLQAFFERFFDISREEF